MSCIANVKYVVQAIETKQTHGRRKGFEEDNVFAHMSKRGFEEDSEEDEE